VAVQSQTTYSSINGHAQPRFCPVHNFTGEVVVGEVVA
jgi:hypothetical protein